MICGYREGGKTQRGMNRERREMREEVGDGRKDTGYKAYRDTLSPGFNGLARFLGDTGEGYRVLSLRHSLPTRFGYHVISPCSNDWA